MITFKKTPQPTELLTVTCEPGSYWQFGPYRAFIKSNDSVITVLNHINGESCIEVRFWISNCEWEPCTQDAFVEWYTTAINRISDASGIQHLPLTITYDNTQNPE